MQTFVLGLKYFFIDLIGGIIRWPIWWYTLGLVMAGNWGIKTIKMYARMLALSVWIKNIFVPMFGFYDWQSRLISIFMRIVNIIGRSIGIIILSIGVLIAVVIYVLILPVAALAFFYQFIGGL